MAFATPAELLPHAGPAVLIDQVLADSPDATTAVATIRADHPYFVAGHGVPVWVGLELMAQTVAVHGALLGRSEPGRSGRGMLLGTRHFDGRVPWFEEGTRLLVCGQHTFGREGGGMAACDFRIQHGDRLLAAATIILLEEITP